MKGNKSDAMKLGQCQILSVHHRSAVGGKHPHFLWTPVRLNGCFVCFPLKGSVGSGLVYGTIPHISRVAPRSCSAGERDLDVPFPRRIEC